MMKSLESCDVHNSSCLAVKYIVYTHILQLMTVDKSCVILAIHMDLLTELLSVYLWIVHIHDWVQYGTEVPVLMSS